ncbi:MAG: Crp/Fnr family transcriptional regulator [Bacteroidota bacterium]
MQQLLEYISQRTFVDRTLEERIRSDFEWVSLSKGTIILEEDRKANYLYFVDKGLVHNYYYLEDGRKITSWFYDENHFVTAWSSFFQQKPSFEVIEALEECELYRISYTNYQQLIADFPPFSHFARLLAEEMLSFLDEFAKGWSFLSAKGKYELILMHFPDIELRVKLGLISSFLGISQETLSRLRATK